MPLNNVNSFGNKAVIEKQLKTVDFCPVSKLDPHILKSTLPKPLRHQSIRANAQWLSGEGAGSWFSISQVSDNFFIERQDPDGKIECSGLYTISDKRSINLSEPYSFDYLSHCGNVNIKQGENTFHLVRLTSG